MSHRALASTLHWRLYAGAADVGAFAAEMKKRRFTDRELEMMFKDNPAKAIGLPVATPSAGK